MKKFIYVIMAVVAISFFSAVDMKAQVSFEKNSWGALLKESPFSLGIELTSKYIWRGQEYANGPVMFPSVSYTYSGLSVGAVGAYDFHGDYSELDLFVSYSFKGFTASITDYYYPTAVGSNDAYLNLKNSETGHMWEGSISYEHENVPVWILASTFFAGADKNLDGGQAWSSYAEIGTHYDFLNNNSVSLAVGASLNKSFYNNFETGFSVVNIALKYTREIALGKNFTLPLSASYVINPQKNKSYLNFSAVFAF